MGLELYTIPDGFDKFELDEYSERVYCFPCCCCKYVNQGEAKEPCNSCGHNVNADIKEAKSKEVGK